MYLLSEDLWWWRVAQWSWLPSHQLLWSHCHRRPTLALTTHFSADSQESSNIIYSTSDWTSSNIAAQSVQVLISQDLRLYKILYIWAFRLKILENIWKNLSVILLSINLYIIYAFWNILFYKLFVPVLAESLPVNTVNHPENVLNGQTGLCSDFSYSTARTGPFIGGGGG